MELGLRYKYSTITTLSATASYSYFKAEFEPNTFAIVPFEDLVSDPDEKDIRRKPRRDSISTTVTFKLGYERSLTPTLKIEVDGGVYTNTTDESDTLRAEDRPGEEIPQELLDSLESDTDGWLASVSLSYDAGITRYVAKYAADVEPSSSGSQVEINELTGDLYRILSPRLNFARRARTSRIDWASIWTMHTRVVSSASNPRSNGKPFATGRWQRLIAIFDRRRALLRCQQRATPYCYR